MRDHALLAVQQLNCGALGVYGDALGVRRDDHPDSGRIVRKHCSPKRFGGKRWNRIARQVAMHRIAGAGPATRRRKMLAAVRNGVRRNEFRVPCIVLIGLAACLGLLPARDAALGCSD